jgi:GNAT superfamily N-acetyltransferase
MAEQPEITIEKVTHLDLSELLPLMRAYCDFYEVEPRDDRLVNMSRALIDSPSEGCQLLARDPDRKPVGFATIFWGWSTLSASREGLMNDLYVVPDIRGGGVGRRLIDACRGECRKKGINTLTWSTAPDNKTAQRLYDSTGATSSTWLEYEIDAW